MNILRKLSAIKYNNFLEHTWNRVITAVRIPWKISLVWAIFWSTLKMPKAVIITRAVSFFYSTLASNLRWTTFPCFCISVPCPIASNQNFYKRCMFEILQKSYSFTWRLKNKWYSIDYIECIGKQYACCSWQIANRQFFIKNIVKP